MMIHIVYTAVSVFLWKYYARTPFHVLRILLNRKEEEERKNECTNG
jgi:hypothetical protein